MRGKQTQAERCDHLKEEGTKRVRVSPDYGTRLAKRRARAAREREYGPDVMQLLYIANGYGGNESAAVATALVLVCDRYRVEHRAY